jgi:hypothetical protein
VRTSLFAFNLAIVLSIPAFALAGDTIELARGVAPQHPQQPQLAVDSKGAIHVVFGIGDEIHYCRSDDGGKSFAEPIALSTVHAMSLGMRRGPRIAVTDSAICVTAIGGKHGKGRDGDLLALQSTDGGKTWTGPVAVNDAADAAREGLHAMSGGPKNSICCVWLDLRSGKTEVMASVSADGGRSWDKNSLVYRSPDGSVCECCHPSVAMDPQGRIFVQWRNSLAGARDMYVASSADGGKTFGKAAKLGSGSWPLNACPMDGEAIAVAAPGKVATAWRRDKAIYLLLAGQREERRLGAGEQPWIAATDDGPFVIWLKKRGNAALLLSPDGDSPVEVAAHANDPVIASGPNGQGQVVVAWESHEGPNYRIQCQVVKNAN